MRRRRRHLLLLAWFLGTGGILCAQVNDAQLWFSAGVEKKLTPALSIEVIEELRLNENITEAGTWYTDLGMSYRFLNRFKVGGAYRFSLKRRLDDTYQRYNSWYAEAVCREKFKPMGLALRVRYQSRYAESFTSEKAAVPRNHMRTKLTVKYDLDRKFEPYCYAETYFRCGVSAYGSFDQLRLCAGIEYTFNRMHMIDLHYLFSREYNVANPETEYVIGIEYYFTF